MSNLWITCNYWFGGIYIAVSGLMAHVSGHGRSNGLPGDIIVTGAWMLTTERTRNVNVIHFSAKAAIRADLLFTLPGVLLVLINGLVMVFDRWGGRDAIYQLSWISVALALFKASGIIWVGLLIPAQHRMVVCSDPSVHPDSLPSEFSVALHRWYVWGAIAIALPIGLLYLMVTKPGFG